MDMKYSGERFLPEECEGEMAIEHFQRYQLARQLVKDKVVLDAACGEGYGSSLLAKVAQKVIGLDVDEQVVKAAQKKYGNSVLEYAVGSVEKLPFQENTFDIIISFETIEHVNESIQQKFLEEITRVLKPNGKLIMSTPNKAVYTDLVNGKNDFHIKEFYVNEYFDFLKQKFKYIETFLQYPNVGYFISHENEDISINFKGIQKEKCRYILAVCSNVEDEIKINLSEVTHFDDSMYYFLNARVHELEDQIIRMKTEVDIFERQQEDSISKQKDYIAHLENDIQELNAYIKKMRK